MDTCTGWSEVRRVALVGLLLVFPPNLALIGFGLLMRGPAQRVAEARQWATSGQSGSCARCGSGGGGATSDGLPVVEGERG
jgi:hypothetical protein